MKWRPIPCAEGYEISESGEVRCPDGPLVPFYRVRWGGRRVVISAETLYRTTFGRPFSTRSAKQGVDDTLLEAARRRAERLQAENNELRARFTAFGIDI